MTEIPSKHTLPTLSYWLLGVGIPATVIFLAVGLSDRLGLGWSLLICLLRLATGPGLLVRIGAVSPRVDGCLAYSIAAMILFTYFFLTLILLTPNPLLALWLLTYLLILAVTGLAIG